MDKGQAYQQRQVTETRVSEVTISNPETPSVISTAKSTTDPEADTTPNGVANDEDANRPRYGLEVINSRDEPWHGLTPRGSHQQLRPEDGGHQQDNESDGEKNSATNGEDVSRRGPAGGN
jgi:hypothetical protein